MVVTSDCVHAVWIFNSQLAWAKVSKPSTGRGAYSMKYLLNDRESRGVRFTLRRYRQDYQACPEEDEDLFVFLGDNPEKRLCWSARSARIPTFRTNSGKMYHPATESWMTPKDKLAALGLPVTPETAITMGVPMLPVMDTLRAASIAGNSFHFSTAAVVQLVMLCCHCPTHREG